MNATISHLLQHAGLAQATDVVLSGCRRALAFFFPSWTSVQTCILASSPARRVETRGKYLPPRVRPCPLRSAGGLAAVLHADRWRAALTPSAHLAALVDSGFFLDHSASAADAAVPAAADGGGYGGLLRWVHREMRGQADASCEAAEQASGRDPAGCMFAQVALPHVRVPTFLLQPMYDSWQILHVLGARPDDAAAIAAWGERQAAAVEAALAAGGEASQQHGAFVEPCYHHCGGWRQIFIDGTDQASAFGAPRGLLS